MLVWNSFVFLSLICFLMSSASAVLTLFARRNNASLLWGIICLLLAVWSFGLFLCFSATDPDRALFWTRALNCVISFLPVVLFHFVVVFVEKRAVLSRFLWLYYLITFAYLVSILAWPDGFLLAPRMRFEQFWFPVGGPLFYFFPVLMLLVIGHAIQILLVSKAGQDHTEKLRTNYLLITIVVGVFGAGSTLFLEFDIDIPPYGIVSIAFIIVISTYAILRHDLLDLPETISLISARLLTYIGIFAFIVLVLQSGVFLDELSLTPSQGMFIALLTVFACECYSALKKRIQQLSDNMLVRNKVSTERAFRQLMRHLDGAADFEAMLPLLREFFETQNYVHHYAWYIDRILLEHTLKKRSLQDFERVQYLDESVYQRILFSANDGRRHDRLPAILRLDTGAIKQSKSTKQQMIELMSSEQLDNAYSWADQVPDRELIGLPIIAHNAFRGLLLVVVSKGDIRYADQAMLQSLSAKLAAVIERVEYYRRRAVQQQDFLLEKMTSLQALAGSIAHEMRTPLMQMDNFVSDVASVIEEKQQMTPGEKSSHDLVVQSQQTKVAIKRSLQVIDITLRQVRNSLIDASKFETISIQAAVTQALAEYVFLTGERDHVNCDLRQSFSFNGDLTLLIYVVFNLLKNALYYAHCTPSFEVVIRSQVEGGDNLLIFRDNGPGIPIESVEHIFDDFFSTDEVHGAGLGLAYCQRVMRAFNGNISCSSELGEFTEFQLRFPLLAV